MFETSVYTSRRKKLRQLMQNGLVLIMGNQDSPMSYPSNAYRFRQDSSFLYFFGLNLPGLAGVIDLDEGKDMLFGDDVTLEDIIWMGHLPSLKENGAKVGVNTAFPYAELEKVLSEARTKGRPIHFLPPYRAERTIELERLLGIPHADIKNHVSEQLIKAVVKLRLVKDEFEIAEIENYLSTATYDMHMAVMHMAKPGIVERSIAGYIEGISLSYGGTVCYPVILTSHGETMHIHSHDNVLKNGDLLLTDAGAETPMGYATDITRTIPVGGKYSQKQKDIYNVVLAGQLGAIAAIKAGVRYMDVHFTASKIIAQGLKDLGLMKGDIDQAVQQGAHALFFSHGIGHSLGLDVHDMEDLGEDYVGYDEKTHRSNIFGTAYLRIGKELEAGNIVTVEPGVYFIPALIDRWEAEKKFTEFINYDKVDEYRDFGGIRTEDNVLATPDGHRILGKPIPKTVEEVEETMK